MRFALAPLLFICVVTVAPAEAAEPQAPKRETQTDKVQNEKVRKPVKRSPDPAPKSGERRVA